MSSYRHLEKVGIQEGEPLSFNLRTIEPNHTAQVGSCEVVEGLAGGGFNGSVILLKDSVIKTAQPGPLHELLRQMNWPTPYPSRSSEVAAQLDYVAGRLLHKVVPAVTPSAIRVPEALGYTKLPGGLGYGQVIERVSGRGPTFMDDGSENQLIDKARHELWDLGVTFGIEHAAQIHPDNPFGKPNLWIAGEEQQDDHKQLVWLDYLPAFRHTGFVKPMFYFGFHKDVRAAFNSDTPTFNRINTETMRSGLMARRSDFTDEEFDELLDHLTLYDELWDEHAARQAEPARSLFIDDAVQRQLVDSDAAQELREHPIAYRKHRVAQTAQLALRATVEIAEKTPAKLLWHKEPWQNFAKFFKDSDYRRDKIIGGTLLRGYKKAQEHGQVSRDEYNDALSALSPADLNTYTAMQIGFFAISRAHDIMTVPLALAAATSSRPAEAAAAVVAFNTLSPGVFRSAGALAAGRVLKKDFKRMALITAAPLVGGYAAIPAQIKRDYGENAKRIMHYNLRNLAATASSVRPHGGWGSDLEETVWNTSRNFTQGRLDTPLIKNLKLDTAERARRYPAQRTFGNEVRSAAA